MAVTRTALPRKGLIQSQHGLTGYEADQDANWLLLDQKVAFVSDLLFPDFNLNGVVSGFTLGLGSGLTPTLTTGILYANGSRYAPSAAPTLGAANSNTTNYLWYNTTTGFYYTTILAPSNTGDALLGIVVTGISGVIALTQATKIFGQVSLTPGAAGNFSQGHVLGRTPVGAIIQMTSAGSIWFQSTMFDSTSLYLVASEAGVTAKALLW
jgi:hypothetical protein